ncbi:hypothetical protein H8959_010180 [Pygathrix nigripes]
MTNGCYYSLLPGETNRAPSCLVPEEVEASKALERYYRNGGDKRVPELEWQGKTNRNQTTKDFTCGIFLQSVKGIIEKIKQFFKDVLERGVCCYMICCRFLSYGMNIHIHGLGPCSGIAGAYIILLLCFEAVV